MTWSKEIGGISIEYSIRISILNSQLKNRVYTYLNSQDPSAQNEHSENCWLSKSERCPAKKLAFDGNGDVMSMTVMLPAVDA